MTRVLPQVPTGNPDNVSYGHGHDDYFTAKCDADLVTSSQCGGSCSVKYVPLVVVLSHGSFQTWGRDILYIYMG